MITQDRRTAAAFEAFGARIHVLAPAALGDSLRVRLPPGAAPATGGGFDTTYTIAIVPPGAELETGGYELFRDGATLGRTRSLEKVERALESDVHFHIARCARGFLFVHAGVVAWQQRAIVLPGRSMSGKSSLVLALVRAGAAYFSDEFAVIESGGRILPYPKPLSERRGGQSSRHHSPDALGARPDTAAVPLGLVAVLRFRAGARWHPRSLSRAEALLALFDNTVVAQTDPEFALGVLARAVDGCEALEGERGEASAAAVELLNAQRPLGA